MTPSHLLQAFQAQGFRLFLAGDSLKFTGLRELTPEEREVLQSHKPEIIQLLHARESVRRDLMTLYAQIGQHTKSDLERWESKRPGFKATWARLESAFAAAWQCGQDCGLELEALMRLFQETQHTSKGKRK